MTGLETSSEAGSFDLLRMDRQIQRRQTRRRIAKVIGWTGVVAVSISRGGVLGWLVAGGGMFGLVHELVDWRDDRPEWQKQGGAHSHGVIHRLLTRHRADAVDKSSQFSFPASDPPAGASG